MNKSLLKGYLSDEINDVAAELVQHLMEGETPSDLGLLALCRAIVMVSSQDDLDLACRIIDEMSLDTLDQDDSDAR